MKYPAAFLALLLAGCGGQAQVDRAKLDALLTNNPIDTVILTSLHSTNVFTGVATQNYVQALNVTNRLTGASSKAQLEAWVRLMSGTNEVALLYRYETGDWNFGDFAFRLRSSP
jgi:hypothetical protein